MVAIKHLKEGRLVMIDGEPCKVVSIATSKSGKHGSAKTRVEAIGLFDGKKRSVVKPADSEVEVPMIIKKKAQVISIQGNVAQLMDLETYETFDLEITEEWKDKIKEGEEAIYWEISGKRTFPLY